MNEKVLFPKSTYVWCKGKSVELGRHPIFVSSPVTFEQDCDERCIVLACKQSTCSAFGKPMRYAEKDIGFQDCQAPELRKCG